jgi:hypothetical protein
MNYTIQLFNDLMAEGKIKSINAAAKAMNISSSALSQYLKGIYKGNVDKVEKEVSSWLRLIQEREQLSGDTFEWVDGIKNSELVLGIARLTHLQKSIGVVIGRSGLCKTMALKKYASEHPDTIYIEVDGAYSAKEVMKEIAINCGGNGIGHLNHVKKQIIEKLKDSGRMIILDQAEYLSDKTLDIIRTIHDKAGVGLLLAGMPHLMDNIKGNEGVHEQIYTRVGAAIELEPLTNEDIEKLVHSYDKNSNGLWNKFVEPSRKNGRVLRILYRESKRIAKNKGVAINEEHIKIAAKQLIK